MITRYVKPTSERITYTGPHSNLASSELSKVQNRNKILYNDATGAITFLDGAILDAIEPYPTLADFPEIGAVDKFYLDESESKLYRYYEGSYYFFPNDVFSKVDSDNRYYQKADIYTKTETDSKFVIRSNANNDMSGSEINNLVGLSVTGAFTANSTAINIEKPLNMGWNNLHFVQEINDKLKLDLSNIMALSNLDMGLFNILNAGAIGVSNVNATTINTTTLNSPLVSATNLNTGNLRNTSGASILDFSSGMRLDVDINANGKWLYGLNWLDCNAIRAIDGSTAFTFGSSITSNKPVDLNGNNMSNANTIGAASVNTGNISAVNGTLAMVINEDDVQMFKNINANTANISNVSNIFSGSINSNNISNASNISSGSISTTTINDSVGGAALSIGPDIVLNKRLNASGQDIIGINSLNSTNVNSTYVNSNNLRRADGTQMITLEDGAMNFNYKTLWDVGTIETQGLHHDDSTPMITFPDNATVYMNARHMTGVNSMYASSLNSNFINRGNSVPMIHFRDSVSPNGGNNEMNLGGRLRFMTDNGADDFSIYNFPAWNELHIIGGYQESTGKRKIGLYDDVYVNNAFKVANAKSTFHSLDITDSYGIGGKIRFNGAALDILTDMYLATTSIYGLHTCNATNVNTTNMNSEPAKNIGLCRKATFTTAGGSETFTVNAGAGYRMVIAQWYNQFDALVDPGTYTVTTTDSSSSLTIDRPASVTITCRYIVDKD